MKEKMFKFVRDWFYGLLALLFITLKLTGCIFWNWLWVLSPLWLPIAITTFIAVGLFLCVSIFWGIACIYFCFSKD